MKDSKYSYENICQRNLVDNNGGKAFWVILSFHVVNVLSFKFSNYDNDNYVDFRNYMFESKSKSR